MGGRLSGRRVVVTRARAQAQALVDLLEADGAEVLVFPCIEIVDPEDFAPADEALRRLDEYDWIVFTSANTVERFTGRAAALSMDLADAVSRASGLRVAAVGPATAAALVSRGVPPDFVPEEHPETVAPAIRIGNPASGRKALKAIYDTGGLATDVTDEEIVAAQKLLGKREGVGVEPASAASIAGVVKLRQQGQISKGERVVCVCTGNLLKDPDTVIKNAGQVLKAGASVEEVKRLVLG